MEKHHSEKLGYSTIPVFNNIDKYNKNEESYTCKTYKYHMFQIILTIKGLGLY